jgi:hypothetical protein
MHMIRTFIISSALTLCLLGCRSSIVDDPSTRISFDVTQPSHVTLTIENSYNTVMSIPLDGDMTAGMYAVNVDASSWVEGIYYYTLECKGINSDYYLKTTKTMLLIK